MKNFIIIILITASCISPLDTDHVFHIAPEIEHIVTEFFEECMHRNIYVYEHNLIIELSSDISEHGLCYCQKNNRQKIIKLNKNFIHKHIGIDSANYNYVKLVVYHEIGHWIGMGHRPGLSIMNSGDWFENNGDFIGTVQKYNSNDHYKQEILDEFFNSI